MAVRLGSLIPLVLITASLSACSTAAKEAGVSHFSTLPESVSTEAPYLPKDLPIPLEAGITFTEAKLVDGKKSAMLIYETTESMTLLGSTYQKYIGEKQLEHGTLIVEPDNLLIRGKVSGNYSYSIIGSSSAVQPGDAEIIVTWMEN
ncbi:hypothetical protein [Paenibacillus tepidiphilus]|uniref:hypothetical protein n=1 Tax=Paenibacillus tepidiphilus TaxID=2608683 RepID=UPI001239C9D0|nr:hypothetical protein [Paenibacillus tepidiphilus]